MANSISVAVGDIDTMRLGEAAGVVVAADFAGFELLPHAVSTDSATTTAAMVFFTG
jgi:hypothetical protein